MSSTTLAIVVIVAVAALALLLRRGSGSDAAMAPRPDHDAPEPARDHDEDEEEDLDAEGDESPGSVPSDVPLPVTSAGVAVVPSGRNVRLVSLQPPEEDAGRLEPAIAAGTV